MSVKDGTAHSALQYLDELVVLGERPASAIIPLKTALSKVLSTVKGDKWGDVKVRSIDVDAYMDAFKERTETTYASHTLVVYKSRLNKVKEWYVHFLNTDWATSAPNHETYPWKAIDTLHHERLSMDESGRPSPDVRRKLVNFPFPLLSGEMGYFNLPARLPKKEIPRIIAFLESIAIGEEEDVM
jgi:hypothetical protein